MSTPVLPFLLPGFTVDTVRTVDTTLLINAHSVTPQMACPSCQQVSFRVHSRYCRIPRDLPVTEQAVRLVLRVRRFFCDNPTCTRHTFAEHLPEFLPFRAQRTCRLTRTFQVVAHALGGMAGSRLAHKLRIGVSHDTLLRVIRQDTPAPSVTPRVLGVDDFALPKGRVYGTILVDLEQRQPIDLLPDRTAETLATWLREHSSVAVIARDRSTEYARGASDGAPAALQVADRWHILKNHREALERMLGRLHAELTPIPEPPTGSGSPTPPFGLTRALRRPSPREQTLRQAARTRRMTRYHQVQELYQQGVLLLQIAKRLRMSRATVRAFASAAVFPERANKRKSSRMIDAYLPYLQQRWAEGCTNASQLWREMHAQGYPGVRKQVARWAQHRRSVPIPMEPTHDHQPITMPVHQVTGRMSTNPATTPSSALAAPRRLVWLLLRSSATFDAEEQATCSRIQQHPQVAQAISSAQEFQAMVRQRQPERLDAWLAACQESGIAELQSFATGRVVGFPMASLQVPHGFLAGRYQRISVHTRQRQSTTYRCTTKGHHCMLWSISEIRCKALWVRLPTCGYS